METVDGKEFMPETFWGLPAYEYLRVGHCALLI